MDLQAYRAKIRRGFRQNTKDGVVYFTIPSFEELGFLRHGFMSRIGGVSQGCFSSLNLSFKREQDEKNIFENFKIAAKTLEIDPESLVLCHYEHGTNIAFAGREHFGMGIWRENTLPFCDGVAVSEPGVTAVTIHADCNPIFFADKKGRAAGVCHAGWRGTYGDVIATIVRKFREEKGIRPEEILFGIGPSIGPCCFEVQEDVGGKFREKFGGLVLEHREGRMYVDLWSVLLLQMEAHGVPPENVTLSGLCTYCNTDLFYSYRRDHGQTGAMGSFIQLRR